MWPDGYEAAIDNNPGNGIGTGTLISADQVALATYSGPSSPARWFTFEVIASDNHIITRVNGTTTVDYTDPLRRHSSGHIALQAVAHGGAVEFRKIEIKVTDRPKPAEVIAPAAKEEATTEAAPSPAPRSKPTEDQLRDLALGKKLCLIANDWERGLPLLAKSGDERFGAIAGKDLAAPILVQSQLDLANQWVSLSKKVTSKEKTPCLRRTKYWFLKALAQTAGPEKTVLLSRLGRTLNSLPARPVVVFFEVRGVDGHQDLWVSNDGVESLSNSYAHPTVIINKSVILDTNSERKIANANNSIFIPEVVNFANAKLLNVKHGNFGEIRVTKKDESGVVIHMVHPPAGACNFSFNVVAD